MPAGHTPQTCLKLHPRAQCGSCDRDLRDKVLQEYQAYTARLYEWLERTAGCTEFAELDDDEGDQDSTVGATRRQSLLRQHLASVREYRGKVDARYDDVAALLKLKRGR